jgi:type II secretory pathway pseudopilin PulG
MNTRQRGVTLSGLLIVLVILGIVAALGLKLIPAYIEYAKAKAAIEAIGADRSKSGSVAEIRKSFDARANIDDITAVRPQDLEVTKEAGDVVISFAYRKEIPLAGNVGLYVDFAARSRP